MKTIMKIDKLISAELILLSKMQFFSPKHETFTSILRKAGKKINPVNVI